MDDKTFAWTLFGVYAVVTAGLALYGARQTKSMSSFAVGNQDMGPGLVGMALAASMASTATFVINPGFVYADGLVLYGARNENPKKFRIRDKNIFNGIMTRMKRWFKEVV